MHVGTAPEVVVVIGDGTYLMNPTELVTAVQEGLKITVVVLDNGGYQSIDRLAIGSTGRPVGNEFRTRGGSGRFPDGERVGVDFVANAASLGCRATLAADVRVAAGRPHGRPGHRRGQRHRRAHRSRPVAAAERQLLGPRRSHGGGRARGGGVGGGARGPAEQQRPYV